MKITRQDLIDMLEADVPSAGGLYGPLLKVAAEALRNPDQAEFAHPFEAFGRAYRSMGQPARD